MRSLLSRSTALPYLLVLFGGWIVYFWQYFIPGPSRVTYPTGDFTYQFFIFRDIAYRALAVGHWPNWANCFYAGYPFQADPQSQLFYPPIWLSFGLLKLLGWGNFPIFALTIETALHYLAVSVFVFLFLRAELEGAVSEPLSRSLAALLGALVFTYSGYLTSYPPLQTAILETVTWLPLILLLLNRLASATTHSWRWAVLTALVFAIAFFAGHPQTFLFVVYLSAAYFVYRSSLAARRWRWMFAHLAVIFGVLFGLSLIQLLPEAQYLTLSNRAAIPFNELAAGFPLGIVVQFFISDPVWSPLYLGLLPVALALIAALRLRTRPVYFWISVTVLGFLLALGGNTPLYSLAYWVLPGFRLFRDQERLALVVSFALTVLAAFGLAWLLTVPRVQILRAIQIAGVVISVGTLATLWRTYNPAQADWGPRASLLIVALALTLIILFVGQLRTASPALWGGGLIALAGLNLLAARTSTNTIPDFEAYPYYPILDPIRADPDSFFRVQDDAQMQGHFACGYGFKEWAGISPIRPAAWVAFDEQAPESLRWKLIGMKYLITWKNGAITREEELPPAERVAEGASPKASDTKVYRMFEIPRRAWLVVNSQSLPDSASIYQQLKTPGFDPFSQAILKAPVTTLAPAQIGKAGENNVTILEDWPGHLVLQTESASPAILVVSEAYYPGWAATVNGQPTSVYEADGLVQALAVPAGQSTVTLDFKPLLFTLGAWGSALTLFFSLGFLLFRWPRVVQA